MPLNKGINSTQPFPGFKKYPPTQKKRNTFFLVINGNSDYYAKTCFRKNYFNFNYHVRKTALMGFRLFFFFFFFFFFFCIKIPLRLKRTWVTINKNWRPLFCRCACMYVCMCVCAYVCARVCARKCVHCLVFIIVAAKKSYLVLETFNVS